MAADKNLEKSVVKILLNCKSATDFCINVYKAYKTLKPQISLESFARKGNFSSKIQVHYLVTGKRKLTLKTLECLSKALSLQLKHKKILLLLLELEEKIDPKKQVELVKLRAKLQSSINDNSTQDLCSEAIIKVFLSLKKNSQQNSLEYIQKRTGLTLGSVQTALKSLAAYSYLDIDVESGHYILLREHLDLREYGENEAFKKVFLSCLNSASGSAKNDFNRPESLFFNSFLTVKKANLPELAKKLQDLLSEFADENIDDEGQEIATLTTAFHL